jgi:serine protease inhibitor
MVKHALALLTIGLVSIGQIQAQCLSSADDSGIVNRDARKLLYKGEQIFTALFLRALNEVTPNENVFFSPYSLYHALLLAYFGSRNTTEKELKVIFFTSL